MTKSVKKPLSNTILIILTISVAVVMATVTYFTAIHQTNDMKRDMAIVASELASAVLGGIEYPMSIGDSETVKKQLLDTRQQMKGIEILICDQDQEIKYASHSEKLNTLASHSMYSQETRQALSHTLTTGTLPPTAFEEEVEGKKTLVTIFPVVNKEDCYHCHGSSKNVLGSIIVRMSTERTYANIVKLRNQNIFVSLLGILGIIALIYILLTKKITDPLSQLVVKIRDFTEKIPSGDFSMRIDLKRDDEIGVLVSSFNQLAEALEQKNNAVTSSNLKLASANKELEAFAYSVSHDLRAPLRNIDGFSKILLEDYTALLDDQGKHYLQRVRNGTNRMGNLIDDILYFSRAGRTELNLRPLDCNNMMNDVLRGFIEVMKEKDIEIKVEDLPVVMGDSTLLQSVFNNLVSNAIKFSKKNERAKIVIGYDGDKKAVFVKDNGIGFDMNYHDKIFQLFQRLHLPEEYEGTGLGLAIIKRIVERHKGSIWAESEPGSGTTFYVQLPLEK